MSSLNSSSVTVSPNVRRTVDRAVENLFTGAIEVPGIPSLNNKTSNSSLVAPGPLPRSTSHQSYESRLQQAKDILEPFRENLHAVAMVTSKSHPADEASTILHTNLLILGNFIVEQTRIYPNLEMAMWARVHMYWPAKCDVTGLKKAYEHIKGHRQEYRIREEIADALQPMSSGVEDLVQGKDSVFGRFKQDIPTPEAKKTKKAKWLKLPKFLKKKKSSLGLGVREWEHFRGDVEHSHTPASEDRVPMLRNAKSLGHLPVNKQSKRSLRGRGWGVLDEEDKDV